MKALAEIAQRFLDRSVHTIKSTWLEIPEAVELFEFFYEKGRTEVWVEDYRDHLAEVRAKKIGSLNLHEVLTYLTAIIAQDRTWDSFGTCLKDGTVDQLLTRYLKLVRNGDAASHT